MTRDAAVKLEAEEVTPRNALTIAAALGKEWSKDDAIVYAVRRILALAKDKARKEAGKAPTHLYTPDLNALPVAVAAKLAREAAAVVATYVEPAPRVVKAPKLATVARSVKP